MHSVQHVSILKFSNWSTFTKMVNQLNSVIQNLLHCYKTLHNFLKQPCIFVTLPNGIKSSNFWHIFDSGSKFEILKPNSSWLTFGISKFVSLSISHFLFLFLQLFYIMLSDTNLLAITSQITIILAITPQNYYHIGYSISKFNFILLYQTQH